jgi:hypothetical protein
LHEWLLPYRIRLRLFLRPLPLWELNNVGRRTLVLDPWTLVKIGPANFLAREAAALRFLAAHPALTVPRLQALVTIHPSAKVWGAGRAALVMTRLSGEPLNWVWDRMSEAAQDRVIDELARCLRYLQSVPPPSPHAIASCTGGSCFTTGFSDDTYGPFPSVASFHDDIVARVHDYGAFMSDIDKPAYDDFVAELARLRTRFDDACPVAFCHGDLTVRSSRSLFTNLADLCPAL